MTGPFKVLEARDHVLKMDENGIASTISIDGVTPVGSQNRQRLLTSKNHGPHTPNLHKDRQDEIVVHKIVGHRQKTNGRKYQVRWYGYKAEDDTFEPSSNILHLFLTMLELSIITDKLDCWVLPCLMHSIFVGVLPYKQEEQRARLRP